jgi:hypothetical protein
MLRAPVRFALHYVDRGWFVVPLCWPHLSRCNCGRGYDHHGREGKVPLFKDYMDERMSADDILRFWRRKPRANIGVLLEPSRLFVVDLDGPEAVEEALEKGLPETLIAKTASGYHYYYKRPKGVPAHRYTNYGESGKIDLLSKGFVVAPPSLHKTGHLYVWMNFKKELPEPPEWALPLPGWLSTGKKAKPWKPRYAQERQVGEQALRDALGYLNPEEYQLWLHMGFALKQWEETSFLPNRGFELWDEWSRRSVTYPGTSDLRKKWSSFKREDITVGTLIKYARDAGWDRPLEDKPLFRSSWKDSLHKTLK